MGVGDKRKFEEMGMTHGSSSMQDSDIWSEFQSMMMSSGGNRGIVDLTYQSSSAPSASNTTGNVA